MKKIKTVYNASDYSGEMYIYDFIGKDWFGDGIDHNDVKSALAELQDAANINLHINSPGGDVFAGYAIYNQLLRHPANIAVTIDGLCASIATVIAMVGGRIDMAKNALFMIHNPWTFAMGDAKELAKTIELLELNKDSIITTYQTRSHLESNELSDLMDEETWMNADEALNWGFVTEISGEAAMAACADPMAKYWMHKAPHDINFDKTEADKAKNLFDDDDEEQIRQAIINDESIKRKNKIRINELASPMAD